MPKYFEHLSQNERCAIAQDIMETLGEAFGDDGDPAALRQKKEALRQRTFRDFGALKDVA